MLVNLLTHTVAAKQFAEEVSVLLMSIHTKKKSLVELTRNYNEVFRGPATASKLPPITAAEMADTLTRFPSFSVRTLWMVLTS